VYTRRETDHLVTPSAARLTESLRDIGYDLPTAVADLVDNSVSAGATAIDVVFRFFRGGSFILISDDGCGMQLAEILEALRFGTRRSYAPTDLGRFGLGLKTASLSQGRRLTVVSRPVGTESTVGRTLDLTRIAEHDEWIVGRPATTRGVEVAFAIAERRPGTVIVLEDLDRVVGQAATEANARRRLANAADKTREHLAMVFHRFLSGEHGYPGIVLNVDDDRSGPTRLAPWDPFATAEPATVELPALTLAIQVDQQEWPLHLRRFILPAKAEFSSVDEFERMSGPLKWNRQQGLYVYRAGRLIQSGGWARLRAIDEHTKLARAALDFQPQLDRHFQTNVSKMSVNLPGDVRSSLGDPLHELALKAATRYRLKGGAPRRTTPAPRTAANREVGFALRMAADLTGDSESLVRILAKVREVDPGLGRALG
jgi:Histidine kinase-, DNA gyrase B-, and HSP90-like ATPase